MSYLRVTSSLLSGRHPESFFCVCYFFVTLECSGFRPLWHLLPLTTLVRERPRGWKTQGGWKTYRKFGEKPLPKNVFGPPTSDTFPPPFFWATLCHFPPKPLPNLGVTFLISRQNLRLIFRPAPQKGEICVKCFAFLDHFFGVSSPIRTPKPWKIVVPPSKCHRNHAKFHDTIGRENQRELITLHFAGWLFRLITVNFHENVKF